MAQIIPATPIQGSSPEVIRLFHVLKRLPEEMVISQRLPTLHGAGPDFLVIAGERLLFTAVSPATPQDAQHNQQPDLFAQESAAIGETEEAMLLAFVTKLKGALAVPTAVLFPNLTTKQIQAIRPTTAPSVWVGKEWLSPDKLTEWLNGRFSAPLTPEQMDHIRQLFTPEVIVPAAFTVRQPIERHTEAGLTPYLLDYDQEHALKLDLNLPQAGHKTAQDFQLRLINGVAGSQIAHCHLSGPHFAPTLSPQTHPYSDPQPRPYPRFAPPLRPTQ
jgi:hypothetical protein